MEDVSDLSGRLDDVLAPHLGDRVVPAALGDLRAVLELATTRLAALRTELLAVPQDGAGDVAARRSRALRSVEVLSDDVSAALDLDGGPVPGQKVAWTEGSTRRPSLQVAPVDVARVLDQRLWAERTVVLTSATVPAR